MPFHLNAFSTAPRYSAKQAIAEGLPFDVGHGKPQPAGGFPRVEHRQNVGMLERGCELDFSKEALRADRRREFGMEHLERYRAVVPEIVREVDR
jgi:hypothetical protein